MLPLNVPAIFPEHLETEKLLLDPEYAAVNVSTNKALSDQKYFFSADAGYSICPYCLCLMELQADAYGQQIEGPGTVFFLNKPDELRCPQCLRVVERMPTETWWLMCAVLEMDGFEMVSEDHYTLLDNYRNKNGCVCSKCQNPQKYYDSQPLTPCLCKTCATTIHREYFCNSHMCDCKEMMKGSNIHG